MKTHYSVGDLRRDLSASRRAGDRIGFIPTMGALHEGHLSLVRTIKGRCDVTVCSIFVNPTQFNDPKDFQAYSIDLDRDAELLKGEGVDMLFAPTVSEIYPNGFQTSVQVGEVSKDFEGASRPGHFSGVATVVTALFNITCPHLAIFGEKDFQQLRVIEQMVRDLSIDVEIVRGELKRDSDGLALSSRNARLSPEGRRDALALNRGLTAAVAAFRSGERSALRLEGFVRAALGEVANAEIDYIAAVREDDLVRVDQVSSTCRILAAITIDGVRLLDNAPLR